MPTTPAPETPADAALALIRHIIAEQDRRNRNRLFRSDVFRAFEDADK